MSLSTMISKRAGDGNAGRTTTTVYNSLIITLLILYSGNESVRENIKYGVKTFFREYDCISIKIIVYQ